MSSDIDRFVIFVLIFVLFSVCPSPPPGVISVKQQRERFRRTLVAAFDSYYDPDHSVPRYFIVSPPLLLRSCSSGNCSFYIT